MSLSRKVSSTSNNGRLVVTFPTEKASKGLDEHSTNKEPESLMDLYGRIRELNARIDNFDGRYMKFDDFNRDLTELHELRMKLIEKNAGKFR